MAMLRVKNASNLIAMASNLIADEMLHMFVGLPFQHGFLESRVRRPVAR